MTEAKVKAKYVAIEVVEKGATKDSTPTRGLFRGIRSRVMQAQGSERQTLYLYLLTKGGSNENEIDGFSVDGYNILSIQMRYGDQQEINIFKANDEDQKLAFDFLTDIVKNMESEKRMVDNDTEIIDMKTYTDVPEDISAKKTEKKKTTTSTPASRTPASWGGYPNYSGTTESYEERKKREEEEKKMRETPTLINRSSELPTKDQLKLMKEMVLKIAAGEYEEEEEEIPEAKLKSSSSTSGDCDGCIHADTYGNPSDGMECDACETFSRYEQAQEAAGGKKK